MEKSLPTVDEPLSTAERESLYQDVENPLERPLLGELKMPAPATERTEPMSRTQSVYVSSPRHLVAPHVIERFLDPSKPPYKVENDYSILCKATVVVVIYFAVGTLSFYLAEDDLFGIKTESFIDALYFCVVTLTTVGYGDLVPGTTLGKLFTSFYVFLGFGLVGALVSGAANYIVEMQEKLLVHSIKRKEEGLAEDYEMSEKMDAVSAFWKVLVSGMTVLTLIIVGVIFLVKVEDMSHVDAFYCVCVTVTTLGYGDHSFKTATGRLFAAIWILTSTVCVAQFFLYVAEMRTFSRQLELAHWVLHRKTTLTDLQAADLDGDGAVSAAEFVVFKLKELGKIDQDDVAGILEEFRLLDYDRSGTISVDDLKASQGDME